MSVSNNNQMPNWLLAHRDQEYKTLLEEYDPQKVGNLGWKYLTSEHSKISEKVVSGGLVLASVAGGGYAGAKAGGIIGLKYGKFTGPFAKKVTIASGIAGGIAGGYISYKAINSLIQKKESFTTWKGSEIDKGIKNIFDLELKKYFLNNDSLDQRYCSDITQDLLKEPVTMNGKQIYDLCDVKKLKKNADGKIIDAFTRIPCDLKDYIPAHRKVIDMSAIKIYALWKEFELEQIDWTVRWQLIEYLDKASKKLESFNQNLRDKWDKVFENLYSSLDKKADDIQKKIDKAIEERTYSQLSSLSDQKKIPVNKIKKLNKVSDMFKKYFKIIRDSAQNIGKEILKLRNRNVSSNQVPTIHASIKKIIQDLIKATHKNTDEWVPKEIYQ